MTCVVSLSRKLKRTYSIANSEVRTVYACEGEEGGGIKHRNILYQSIY